MTTCWFVPQQFFRWWKFHTSRWSCRIYKWWRFINTTVLFRSFVSNTPPHKHIPTSHRAPNTKHLFTFTRDITDTLTQPNCISQMITIKHQVSFEAFLVNLAVFCNFFFLLVKNFISYVRNNIVPVYFFNYRYIAFFFFLMFFSYWCHLLFPVWQNLIKH